MYQLTQLLYLFIKQTFFTKIFKGKDHKYENFTLLVALQISFVQPSPFLLWRMNVQNGIRSTFLNSICRKLITMHFLWRIMQRIGVFSFLKVVFMSDMCSNVTPLSDLKTDFNTTPIANVPGQETDPLHLTVSLIGKKYKL